MYKVTSPTTFSGPWLIFCMEKNLISKNMSPSINLLLVSLLLIKKINYKALNSDSE